MKPSEIIAAKIALIEAGNIPAWVGERALEPLLIAVIEYLDEINT